jgi:hypothetical protein
MERAAEMGADNDVSGEPWAANSGLGVRQRSRAAVRLDQVIEAAIEDCDDVQTRSPSVMWWS